MQIMTRSRRPATNSYIENTCAVFTKMMRYHHFGETPCPRRWRAMALTLPFCIATLTVWVATPSRNIDTPKPDHSNRSRCLKARFPHLAPLVCRARLSVSRFLFNEAFVPAEIKTGGDAPWQAEPVREPGGYPALPAGLSAPPTGGPASRATTTDKRAADGTLLRDRVRSLQLGKEVTASSSGLSWVKWTIVLVVLFAASWGGYQLWQRAKSGDKPAADIPGGATGAANSATGSSAPAGVADSAHGGVMLESKGYIIPVHEILVSPKISGMVLKLEIIEGQRVQQGKVLAVLESIEYKADLDHARAILAGAKQRLLELENGSRPEEKEEARAELAETEAQVVQLKSQWERTKRLHETGAKVVTDNEYEVAIASYQAMARRTERLKGAYALMLAGPRVEKIEAARAEVGQVQADFDKSQWRFDNCVVKAPVSGTILKKNAEEGNIVNPIVFNGSYSICTMANLADLEVDLTIQERDIAHVFVGQFCQVHTDAYPDRIYDGFVSRLMPTADRAKGAIPVRVKLRVPSEEEGVYLKPEMGAIVSFYEKKAE